MNGIGDLKIVVNELAVDEGQLQHTFFHALIWSSVSIKGTWGYPPACGAMKVASLINKVPGVLLR